MNKTFLVLRHEIYILVSRFSFWFGVLGIPLIGFLIWGGAVLINHSQAGAGDVGAMLPIEQVREVFTEEEDERPQGYVDRAGLITAFPREFSKDQLIGYASEAEAERDLQAGRLSAYYVIPENYVEEGQVFVYAHEYNLINTTNRSANLSALITYNLLGGDEALARAVRSPLAEVEHVSIAPAASPARDRDDMWSFILPYGIMMLFYMNILGSAGLLLNSVAKEKENRTMEVLLVSTRPLQLLMGKITGLGLVGLFQMVIWLVSSSVLLTLTGQNFTIPAGVELPLSTVAWGAAFFVLGYLVYASLMAGVGALVPNLREASQVTVIVVIPLMVPLFLISSLIESPNSGIAVGLSLFPLTAPTTMMLRLAAVNVPVWQPLVALAGLVLTTYGVIRVAAGMFRAQLLLSGQPFKVKRFFLALIGKV